MLQDVCINKKQNNKTMLRKGMCVGVHVVSMYHSLLSLLSAILWTSSRTNMYVHDVMDEKSRSQWRWDSYMTKTFDNDVSDQKHSYITETSDNDVIDEKLVTSGSIW